MKPRRSKRGGDRLTGRLMPSNTSGLNAIGFGLTLTGHRFVRVAYGDRRASFSVTANGVNGALQKAIEKRKKAGLPVPSMAAARRAYNAYDWRGAKRR